MKMPLAAAHESLVGTFETSCDVRGRVDEPPQADHRWHAPQNGAALTLMRKSEQKG
jgi:hypothetical protein